MNRPLIYYIGWIAAAIVMIALAACVVNVLINTIIYQ
jgi:hypothetical protein